MGQPIADISVSITGDYSDLQDKVSQVADAAQAGADQIVSAFDRPDTSEPMIGSLSELTAMFGSAGESARSLSDVYGDVYTTASEVAASSMDLSGAFDSVSASALGLGEAASEAAPPIRDAGDAAQEAGQKAEEGAGGFGNLLDLLKQGAAIAGVGFGLKELGEEALEAYARVETATVSLNILGKGATGAEGQIARLEELAKSDALSFPALLQANTNMQMVQIPLKQIPGLLEAAGNSAAISGRDIGSITDQIDRMITSGNIAPRVLSKLGITLDDLGQAMGVASTEAIAHFKTLETVSEKADVLTAAFSRLKGAAEAQANTLSGAWTVLKNESESAFASIGSTIGPVAMGIMAWLGQVATAVKFVGDSIHALPNDFTDLYTLATVFKGSFSAMDEARAAVDRMNAVLKENGVEVSEAGKSFVKYADDVTKAYIAIHAAAQSSGDTQKVATNAITTAQKEATDELAKAKDAVEAYTILLREHTGTRAELNRAIAQQEAAEAAVNVVTQASRAALTAESEAVKEDSSMWERNAKDRGEALAKMAEFLQWQEKQEAAMKGAASSLEKQPGPPEMDSSNLSQNLAFLKPMVIEAQNYGKALKDAGTLAAGMGQDATQAIDPFSQLDAAAKALGLTIGDDGSITTKTREAFEQFAKSGNLGQVEAAWARVNQQVNTLAKTDLPAAVKMQDENIAALQRTNAPLGQILDAEEKRLQLVIQMRAQTGESASSEVAYLTDLQLKTQSLATLSAGLGGIYSSVAHAADQAFGQIGNTVASDIMQLKSLGQIGMDVVKELAQAILSGLITAIVKLGEAEVLNAIIGRTAAATAAVAKITSDAAVGAAAAAASIAAIPIVGPALAPAAAAAMYGYIMTWAPLAAAEHGALLDSDQLVMAHKNEMILPADIAGGLQDVIAGGGGVGGGTTHYHFSGAICPHCADQITDVVGNRLVKGTRRVGGRI